jgi:hypothetical protein
MVDFQTTTTAVGRPIDTRWRSGKFGQGTEKSAQLDPTAFVAGTHYNLGGRTDNVVPSGVAVAKAANNLYVPFDPTAGSAGDPRRKLCGFIADVQGVELGPTPSTSKPTFALAHIAEITAALLPVVAQRTNLGNAEATVGIFRIV